MKKKIYIVGFDDLVNYGFGVCNVFTFNTHEEASEFIKERYLTKCEQEGVKPNEGELYDDYAYIQDRYYWDIFEREIEF